MTEILSAMVGNASMVDSALALLLVTVIWAVVASQRKGIVDWGQMLKDDNGKTSSARVIGMGCFLIYSWVVIALTIDAVQHQDKLDRLFDFCLLMVIGFSGTPIASRLLEIISARVGVQQPAPPPPEQKKDP